MKYPRIGPEERVDLGDGRIAIVVPVEPPYYSTQKWKQVVRIEEPAAPCAPEATGNRDGGRP